MMRLAKYLMTAAAVSMVAVPALAAAPNPAAKLSVAPQAASYVPVSSLRASKKMTKSNHLLGLPILALLAAAAAVTAVTVVATSNNSHSDSP